MLFFDGRKKYRYVTLNTITWKRKGKIEYDISLKKKKTSKNTLKSEKIWNSLTNTSNIM